VLYWRLSTGGESRKEAAEIGDVAEMTIYRWLAREDFRKAWDDPESWAKVHVRKQRSGLELKSLATMHSILDDPEVAPGTRAETAVKALQDIRQTRANETAAEVGRTLLEEFDRWRIRSGEILGDGNGTEAE
jgi:CO dehydrogenase/acetyl-CoA synthase delta subunit